MATLPNSGEMSWAELICYAADFLARTFPKPGSVPESRALARVFGLNSPVSLGSWDHATCSLRTFQGSLIDGLSPEFLENWPDSGMWDLGSAYELRSSGPLIFENESSSWPTLRASSGGGNTSAYPGAPYRPAIAQLAQRWPTARGEDGESAGNHPDAQESLTGITKMWRTPDAGGQTGGPRNRQMSIGEGHQVTIAEQAEHWLTQANNWQTPATDSFRSWGGDRVEEMGLDQQARFFPTPAVVDYKTPNLKKRSAWKRGKSGEQLHNFVEHSLPALLIPDGQKSSGALPGSRRRLNPLFVEWLMGFPPGWTEL